MERTFTVEKGGDRLDVFLSAALDKTRSSIAKAVEDGFVFVNGKRAAKAGLKLSVGDLLSADLPEAKPIEAKAENIPIEIVYEDSSIAVVNKPQGMVTHPAAGSPNGTLVNALLYKLDDLSGINGEIRPGIVHRLDKDTSGLIVIAKNDSAHLALSEQISSKKALRYYYALVEGNLAEEEGIIDKNIGRSAKDRKKMSVVKEGGRRAITLYKVIARFQKYTLVECELKTGRTHQIRVHMKSISHPVVGDATYGKANEKLAPCGQLLHAHKLVLFHPVTGEKMTFEAPLNKAFSEALKSLGFKGQL